jgi:hypothetical protein
MHSSLCVTVNVKLNADFTIQRDDLLYLKKWKNKYYKILILTLGSGAKARVGQI